ncbi:ATP-dependent DNA ligase [Streptomyces sp. NPDC003273]|uniref:ATP-dependent DNA ligase n=1 Tax=Streptomyces sp. NPDC003273 TaxID=3364678 RepID=UPI0036C9F7C3
MMWSLPEPMLTVAVESPALPVGWAAEPKWDGYRSQLAVYEDGRVLLRSRQGTDMTASFPEIRAAAVAQLPPDTGLDGELVVWEQDRLAFERLQQRLVRRGVGAAEAARRWPAHYVVFDLVHAGADLTGWPYARRRAALGELFADRGLEAPLTLCPSTTDPAVARGWLEWAAAGVEGLCFKRLDEPYRPVRSWRKYKVRVTTEAVVGAVTGSLVAPRTVLLGRYDAAGSLQYTGRSSPMSRAVGRALVAQLAPPADAHPWEGWSFSAGWGAPRTLDVVLAQPTVVMEVAVDVARDSAGRWRHPVRAYRVRTDVDVEEVPLFGSGDM